MPWIAKLRKIPKLTGGYHYSLDDIYIVTKVDPKNPSITVINMWDKRTTITTATAQECFHRPQWVTDEQWKTICLTFKEEKK